MRCEGLQRAIAKPFARLRRGEIPLPHIKDMIIATNWDDTLRRGPQAPPQIGNAYVRSVGVPGTTGAGVAVGAGVGVAVTLGTGSSTS